MRARSSSPTEELSINGAPAVESDSCSSIGAND
jgi:hypothetical protein